MSRSRHKSKCGRDCRVCWLGSTNQARLHRARAAAVGMREAYDEVENALVDDSPDDSDPLCDGCDYCDPSLVWWREWQEEQRQ